MRAHPLTKLAVLFKRDVSALDNDPKVQLKIHTFGFYYWTINFPIITYMFFFQQGAWLKWGLFITLIYSIYANWSTDYAGMSSAQAVINTGGGKGVDVKANPLGGNISIEKKD